jgi:prevent-host-death family protein
MKTVNIHAAKTHLSRLVEQAAAGEEIIIAKAGKPMARLTSVPVEPKPLDREEWVRRFREWTESHRDRPTPELSDEALRRVNMYEDRD